MEDGATSDKSDEKRVRLSGNNTDRTSVSADSPIKVSVVVPAYNLAHLIEETLAGLLAQQTSFRYEILVGDDASTDGTRALLLQLAAKHGLAANPLRVLQSEANRGLVANLQCLLSRCRGTYIAYVDGDDLVLPGKLQLQADYLDQHPGCGICYHESDVFHHADGQHSHHYSRDHYNWNYIPQQAGVSELLRYGTFLQASAVMFRRHARLAECIDPRCAIIVDYPFHVANALLGGGSIDYIDRVLGRYRLHSQSFGAQTARSVERREAVLAELLHTCDRARELGADPADASAGRAHFMMAAALYFRQRGDEERYVEWMRRSAGEGCYFDDRHKRWVQELQAY